MSTSLASLSLGLTSQSQLRLPGAVKKKKLAVVVLGGVVKRSSSVVLAVVVSSRARSGIQIGS